MHVLQCSSKFCIGNACLKIPPPPKKIFFFQSLRIVVAVNLLKTEELSHFDFQLPMVLFFVCFVFVLFFCFYNGVF